MSPIPGFLPPRNTGFKVFGRASCPWCADFPGRKHSVQVAVIAKDLSLPDSAQEIYDEVKTAGIEVEYLINNAGVGGQGKFHERDWNDDLAMIQLNVVTLTALGRLFLPDLVSRNSGAILNVSSTASLLPGPLQAVYYATKAYVTFFSNAIAEELRDTRITVTALLPGATETEFARTAGMEKTELFKKTASARSPGSNFAFEYTIVGNQFDYRFDFSSPSPNFGSHMVVDRGMVRSIPEPSAFLCVGLVGLSFVGWKKRKMLRQS